MAQILYAFIRQDCRIYFNTSFTMKKFKAVIFDFDGVILDSANIKTVAFLELFKDFPEHQNAIKEYHIDNQGISRYNKFKWIYEELLGKPYNTKVKDRLGKAFSDLVLKKVIKAEAIPGAIDFLKTLKKEKIPAYVASGTPDKELQKIIEERKLTKYFKSLYGSNISKEEAIDRIAEKESAKYSEMLFIGDAITDYKAAHSRGVPFAAVYSEEMEGFWKGKGIEAIHNLMELYEESN